MLEFEMHDSENGTNSANGAETLVLTNNIVYPESSSNYYDVINNHHHNNHHHHYHNHFHINNHHNHFTPETNQNDNHQSSHSTLNLNHQSSNNIRENQVIENERVVDDEEEEEEEEDEDYDDDGDVDDEGDEKEEEEEDDDDGEEEDDEDDEEEEEDDDESEDEDSEDIVDPGQHFHIVQDQHQPSSIVCNNEYMKQDESDLVANDILDGERMLEVTRKLVRNTERDPDRDLRKQVLLKTAIKKLPHFMDYNRYNDITDRSFHNNLAQQNYYEHHDSQQKFYHSVQPNAIQMSTTSLRMLDLNDDQDPELINTIEHVHNNDSNLVYRRTSLEQHDYQMEQQNQYDSYHNHNQTKTHELNHHDIPSNQIIIRHDSLDNLYQPLDPNDINVKIKDNAHNERLPIALQITCEIYDFTCTPDDNEKKLIDNLTNCYYAKQQPKDSRTTNSPVDCGEQEDVIDSRVLEESDTSSSSHSSSSSDEGANSMGSQSNGSVEANNEASLLETSLNSSSDFYHSSHDSGVAFFNNRSNKRSSSSIGLDDEMDIDHLTELSLRNSNDSFATNNQFKKLRKREIID